MAYRKLKFGDHVRIVDKDSAYHGRDAIVINEINEHWNRVQLNQGRSAVEFVSTETECIDIPNKNLLVRDSEYHFIKDGVLDHQAKSLASFTRSEQVKSFVDHEDVCEYDHWDREDLIREIKELKERLDEVERDWEDS